MTDSYATALCWLLGLVQVLGLTSAFVARLAEGSRRCGSCQRLFLAFLLLIGAATMVAVVLGPGFWLTSAVTLALMVLTVTSDLGRSGEAAAG